MIDEYPIITYDSYKIVDITKRFAIQNIDGEYSKNIYFWHTITTWKSPENVAYDFYGNCDYVWVILSLNNIIHPVRDWLLDVDELKLYIENKYGDAMYDVHHYEKDGILYAPPLYKQDTLSLIPTGATMVTNYDYEFLQNEKKRKIRVLYPELLSTIKHEVKALFV